MRKIKNRSDGIIIRRMIFERSIMALTFLSSAYIHMKIRIDVSGSEASMPPIRLLFLLITETRITMMAVTMALAINSTFIPAV